MVLVTQYFVCKALFQRDFNMSVDVEILCFHF